MAGRKGKLTPAVQDKICSALRAGNYANVAASYAGIGERTYYRWLERGEKATSGIYRQFWQSVKKAEADAEAAAVAFVRKAMPDDWRAAMTYLERRHPEKWGRRVVEANTELTVTNAIPIAITKMDIDEL